MEGPPLAERPKKSKEWHRALRAGLERERDEYF
jgi:hypothetical protein